MKWSKILSLLLIFVLVGAATVFAMVPIFQHNETLGKYFPLVKDINLGLDLQGGVRVVLQAHDTDEIKVDADKMEQLKAVIENRVNALGVSEPIIRIQGKDRLIVELAGVDDPEKAVNTIIQVAYLEFKTEDGETVVSGGDLKDARESKNPNNGEIVVNLEFTQEGAKKFGDATAANVGRTISIILDGDVLQTPVVQTAIPDGKAIITGYSSLEEAHNIALLLRSGALPMQVTVAQKTSVGPTLGSDSLNQSQKAGLVGIIAILIFMLVYYRLPGLIADFALVVYTLIVLVIYLALHVTLTLPGIAAFLLSMAIAVDANIIIFERLKEELRTGKGLRSAIDAGFKRGFTAVFDANLTTIIVAVVLYFLGTGMIKGFAITLIIGIVASMFTALTMTRWLLHLMASTNITKNIKMFGA